MILSDILLHWQYMLLFDFNVHKRQRLGVQK